MASRFLGLTALAAALGMVPLMPANAEPIGLPNASQTTAGTASNGGLSDHTSGPVSLSSDGSSQQPQLMLSDADLGDFRGSGGLVVGNQTLNALSTGNSTIGNYTAGSVSLSDLALSNFNGFGNIVVNTGALSQLQSAMNITVNLTP